MSVEEKKDQQEKFIDMEERIDQIGQELMAEQLSFYERGEVGKNPVTKDERDAHAAKYAEFEGMSKLFKTMKQMGMVSSKRAKTPQEFGKGVMERLKLINTTMGTIVREHGGEK